MQLAQRCSRIDSSGIRKVLALVSSMKNPCNLSIGQPDFDVPDPVKEAAIQGIRDGQNKYTLTAGIPALCEKIMDMYRRRGIEAEDVIVTSGVSGGLMLVFMALLNPGDEVLITDPYFVMYKHLVNFIEAKPVFVDTYPDFRLRRESFEAALTPRTRMVVVNSPHNPTGIVYTEAELRMMAQFAEDHDLILVSDDMYETFVYDGEFQSAAQYAKNPIVMSGLSKSMAMTGWRLGWALGPKNVIKAMANIQMYTFVCAPSPAQVSAMPALDLDREEVRISYRRRRDLIYNGLIEAGYKVEKPQGAFYIFPEAPGGDGDAFCRRALEHELLIVPGSVFSERNSNFRISFAAPEATLRRGVEILAQIKREMS